MPDQDNYNRNKDDLQSWIPTIIMLICFAPVGVIMLLVKLFGQSGSGERRSQHPYDEARQFAQDSAQEARRQAREAADEARRQAREATEEAKRSGRQAADEARRQVRQVVDEVRQQTRQAVDEVKQAAQGAWQQEARQPPPRQTQPPPNRQSAPGQTANRKAPPKQSTAKAARPQKRSMQERLLSRWSSAGKGLTVGGATVGGIFGFVTLIQVAEMLGRSISPIQFGLENLFVPLGFCGVGLVMLYYGLARQGKYRRYRKYLALIGKRDSISVTSLAQAMGVSVNRACGDLQDMLDDGLFPTGFLDMGSGRLFLNDEGLPEEPAPRQETQDIPRGMEREDAVLMEIRQLNDAIADETMSLKIDRIGEITGKIFTYLREKPDKEGQLRSFLSYYLPTTLKILRAYAQMEAQGIEGENITAAKGRIEGMMDKVVDGFETQLDKLFQDDAMDITTDVAVLERMLDKDGLGGGQGLQLGG